MEAAMTTTKNRLISGLLVACLSMGVLSPPALAGMIATTEGAAPGARDRVAQALARADVQTRLEAYGVDPAQVQARVDALSEAEVAQLAGQLDTLPAGGDGFIGAVVFVFLLLLVTDILGLTKIFPFTRPIR